MEKFTRSQTIGLFVVIVVLVALVAIAAIRMSSASATPGIAIREAPAPVPPPVAAPNGTAASPVSAGAIAPENPTPPAPAEVVVHVAGAVKKPGVYHLKADARNDDALQAAGGPAADANTDGINLAEHVKDGTQLYIPTRKEQPTGGAPETAAPTTSGKTGSTATPHPPAAKPAEKSSKTGKLTDPSQGQINLNTADAEQLQRIPGIGPAMAERIIAFRKENGGFKTAEDLMLISGIGEKKFERMKPFVKVR
jgi:competence protein ComEA